LIYLADSLQTTSLDHDNYCPLEHSRFVMSYRFTIPFPHSSVLRTYALPRCLAAVTQFSAMQIMQSLPVKFALQKQSTPHGSTFLPEELWGPSANIAVLLLQNQTSTKLSPVASYGTCAALLALVYWPASPGILWPWT